MGTFQRDTSAGVDQPGAASQPEDIAGDGPVTIEDRTEPGGQGSPDTNQAKTEPLSPTPDHPEPVAVPELDTMNVGAADPQAPRASGVLSSEPSATVADEPVGGAAPGTSEEQRIVSGVSLPLGDAE